MAKLTFLGATQQVTGSCYLIETNRSKVLLECGIEQEKSDSDFDKLQQFRFDPTEIDCVILSHAHLDHSGSLPLLIAKGYRGPIYMTAATSDLLDPMLKDATYLYLKDVEWANKRRNRAGKKIVEAEFTLQDVEQCLSQRVSINYNQRTNVLPDVDLCYQEAGHILGSAIVEIWIHEKGQSKKLVFSGDLGNSNSPLMRDPAIIQEADILLMESTYGNRDHRPLDQTLQEFKDALDAAMDDGGNVLIPSFAVGRTQDLIYRLGQLYQAGKLKQNRVFLDSPMAISVSDIYERYTHLFNKDDPEFRKVIEEGWDDWLPTLRYMRTPEESMSLNQIAAGAIIIAGSGMCNGGRIRHHFKHNLWRSSTHLIISGFQARGTLGRSLVDGAKIIHIAGNEIAVKAKIHTLGGFSAHAGQSQLLTWAKHFNPAQTRLYLVHGEIEAMLALQNKLVTQLDWDAHIPSLGEVTHL